LADIVEECKKYYPRVEDFRNDCDKLTIYYFDRYPADIPLSLSEKDAKFAIEVAGRILLFVEEMISKV
jgi:HEPN domain-containing protein